MFGQMRMRGFKLGFHGRDEKHAKRLHGLTFLLGNKRKKETELF